MSKSTSVYNDIMLEAAKLSCWHGLPVMECPRCRAQVEEMAWLAQFAWQEQNAKINQVGEDP